MNARAMLVLAAVSMFGCAVSTESPSEEGSTVKAGALAGGCRWICPKCKPGEICPKIACFEDCNAAKPCGPSRCSKDEFCCNESCGICAGFAEMCTMQYCEPVAKGHTCVETALCIVGYHWSSTKCACLPDAGTKKSECTTDADCRVEADYCTGCDCLALSSRESVPACSGPGVRCFADPCMSFTAVCVSGSCSVASTL